MRSFTILDIEEQFSCSAPSLNVEVGAEAVDALLKLVAMMIEMKDVQSLREIIKQTIHTLLRFIQRQLDSIVAAIGNVLHGKLANSLLYLTISSSLDNNSQNSVSKRLTALEKYGEELKSSVVAINVPLKQIFFIRLDLTPSKAAEYLDDYLKSFARVLSETKSRLSVYISFNKTDYSEEFESSLSELQNTIQAPIDKIKKVVLFEESTEFSVKILSELSNFGTTEEPKSKFIFLLFCIIIFIIFRRKFIKLIKKIN